MHLWRIALVEAVEVHHRRLVANNTQKWRGSYGQQEDTARVKRETRRQGQKDKRLVWPESGNKSRGRPVTAQPLSNAISSPRK
jgi:hypothetical protein